MTIHEQSKIEASNHREWFQSTFNADEIEQLRNIGIVCQADHKFYKNEILDIFGHIENRKLKKLDKLYQKFLDRYISLIPTFLIALVDRDLIESDIYYAAWFFNRHSFFFEFERESQKSLTNKTKLFLWSPVVDIHTPNECKKYANKVFSTNETLLDHAVIHWEKPRRGCRCALLVLSEQHARKGIESGRYTMWES